MLRPHADVFIDVDRCALGLSVSRIRFPNGRIDSTQWGLSMEVATDFSFIPAGALGTSVAAIGRSGAGFDRIEIVGGAYRSRSGASLIDGAAQPATIRTIGVRVEQAWARHAYWGLEAAGAVQSRVAGYAEYLGSLSLEEAVVADLSVGARVAVGAGSGGGVSVGGGLLAKAGVYGKARLSDALGVTIEGGFATAPHGRFRAASVSAALIWALEPEHSERAQTVALRNDFSVGVEQFNAARRDGSRPQLQAVVLEVDRFLTPNAYLSGQLHSAVAGGAGGYSTALLGAGWLQPLGASWYAGAQLLVGAAGGGEVDSHGSILQPAAYIGLQVTPAVGFRVGVGRVKSLRGPLDANVVSVQLTTTYGGAR